MRSSRQVCAITCVVVSTTFATHVGYTQTADAAAKVLAGTREALGGEARIAAVKTLIATGRTRQVQGDNLVPIEFEIQAELLDKYSRRDEIPARDTPPTTIGFSGDNFVQIPAPPPPVARAGGPAPPTAEQLEAGRKARVATMKQDFVRLLLGMFASSYTSFPLTFEYVAQAEAPQGKADVVDVKGPANFATRLFISAETRLPIMVSWQARTPAGPRGGGPPAPIEHRLYFAEYREVDGLRLPFRVRHAVAGATTEETTFDRFRINARIDPRRFELGN